jgi:hypothetical protein
MPKFSFGLGSEAANQELGEGFYKGECPPAGIYNCTVKRFTTKPNVNGDERLNILLEISEEEGEDKAEYNGYGMFNGINVTEQGLPWLNNMLDGLGIDREKAHGDGGVITSNRDGNKQANVLKLGGVDPIGIAVKVLTRMEPYKGKDQLDVVEYLIEGDEKPAAKKGRAAKAEPEEAAGLDDVDTSATEEGGEAYTEDELNELSPAELKEVCDAWEITYAPKATKATLVKAILKFQDESATDAGEEGTDESEADAGDDLTEADLADMSKEELVEYIEEKGWTVPRPPVASRLRAAILKFQADPPF